MKTTELVEGLVKETVTSLGFELCEVEFIKEAAGWVLTLYIDSPSGVTLDDCERVSRAVDPILDEKDPIEQAYYLSVSSLGLDRPLKKDRDFERNMGELVTVKLYAPLDGKKEYTGTLEAFDELTFTITVKNTDKKLCIKRKDAAQIKPYIEF